MYLLGPLLLLTVAAADVPPTTLLPGGFVQPTGQIGIFNTPNGGVQAVDLTTGKSFFQTNQAQRPLFVLDGRLFALAAVHAPTARGLGFEWQPEWEGPRNGFRIVAFDLVRFGEMTLESETVALPEWASVVDAHDRSFTFQWHTENGRLVLAWEAKAWYCGSTRKTPAEEAVFRKRAEGAVRFDLETGHFETLPPPVPPAPLRFPAWTELERLAIRWEKTTATRRLVVTLEESPGKQSLQLRSFDVATHQLLGTTELIAGQRLVVLPTIDEQHLCVRESVPAPDLKTGDDQRTVRWSIFTVDGTQRVAEVAYVPGTTAAALLGGRAYFLIVERIATPLDQPYVVPRSLRAVNLKTGATQWERPVGGKPTAPPPLFVWPAATPPKPH